MTVKDLLEGLKQFNPSAEIRVAIDLKNHSPETIPATAIHALDDPRERVYFGFSQCLNKKKSKRELKKVVII